MTDDWIQIFECLVDSVLDFEKCDKIELDIGEASLWLLDAFAKKFNVATNLRDLFHLTWIIKYKPASLNKTPCKCMASHCSGQSRRR